MKKLIIIGAGIAGLTTAIYARLNGFDTEIYEMHTIPGGECTGWSRGRYHFDGCIHWLMGSKPGNPLNDLWRDVGALDDSVEIINNDIFGVCELAGKTVNIYRDVDKLEKHLLKISSDDSKFIKRMCSDIRAFTRMDMPVDKPYDMYNMADGLKMAFKMMPLAPKISKYGKITVSDFVTGFKSSLLREAFLGLMPGKYSAIALLSTLASLSTGDSGWPAGGSLKFAKRMEERYKALGGKVFYKSKVEKIIVKDNKALGIQTADGSSHYGDYIISAADGHKTIFDMLEGKYLNNTINKLYSDNDTYPTQSTAMVFAGISCDLSARPHSFYFKPHNKVYAGGMDNELISLKHYCYEPSFAPQGKSVIACYLNADYNWWKEKHKNTQEYRFEKERLAREVCSAIEEKYPETKGNIEVVDVATPVTYERYCNAWKGAWMSWQTTPQNKVRYLPGNLPGLDNFYLTGQWTMPPGGLPTAVMTGKWLIQRLCKKEKIKFKTSI